MAVHYGTDEAGYISMARQHMQNLEKVLQGDRRPADEASSDAWDSAGPKR
jgi:glutathione-regulated potassium-efflux system ancillary protein KefC/glutathione-regulated potassium-efflux system protein KefB